MNMFALLAFPIVLVNKVKSDFMVAMMLTCTATTVFLKLVSFHHVMQDTRNLVRRLIVFKEKGEEVPVNEMEQTILGVPKTTYEEAIKYPNCVTFYDFLRFIFAPTCCFQLNFPLTEKIKWI